MTPFYQINEQMYGLYRVRQAFFLKHALQRPEAGHRVAQFDA
jgi:hypothetical protein